MIIVCNTHRVTFWPFRKATNDMPCDIPKNVIITFALDLSDLYLMVHLHIVHVTVLVAACSQDQIDRFVSYLLTNLKDIILKICPTG